MAVGLFMTKCSVHILRPMNVFARICSSVGGYTDNPCVSAPKCAAKCCPKLFVLPAASECRLRVEFLMVIRPAWSSVQFDIERQTGKNEGDRCNNL